jgi:hypothetical protein
MRDGFPLSEYFDISPDGGEVDYHGVYFILLRGRFFGNFLVSDLSFVPWNLEGPRS